MTTQDNKEKQALYSAAGIAGEMGYIIAGPIVLLGVGGAYADKYFGTSPIFMLIGFVLSFIVSGKGVWSIIQRLNAQEEARERAKKAAQSAPPEMK